MTKSSPPPPVAKTRLAALTKAELISRLESLPCAPSYLLEACPAERLRLELGAHHVELEAQNQELRESQQRIEEARDRYSDLYDFAPVGYATLDRQGYVREINLTGASMLGSERKDVLGKPLILWLQPDCLNTFLQHLGHVCGSSERAVVEVLLRRNDGPPRHISMVSNGITYGPEGRPACRTALVDITPIKEKEAELTLSRQQLRNLSAHLNQVREHERRHLAREIHDELGQKLTILRFEVALLNSDMAPAQPDVSRTAASLLKQIDETIEAVRTIASNLRPAVLDLGLPDALEWQIQEFRRRTGIRCILKISNQKITLDDERATAVFRIVQESLTNICRHAQASEVQINLAKRGDNLLVQVADNGVGLSDDALNKSQSFGISGMRERVRLLDGDLKISSHPGQGTKLKMSIPLPGE